MDIKLGKLDLDYNQMVRSKSLISGKIKGFGQRKGEVTVIASSDLTEAEKSDLVLYLKDLSKAKLPETDREKVKKKKLKDVTLEDVVKVLRSRGDL